VATITDPVESIVTIAADSHETADSGTTVCSAMVGTVVGFDAEARPLVSVPTRPDWSPRPAISCVHLDENHLGGDVVLVFESGNDRKPIILGHVVATGLRRARQVGPAAAAEVRIDGTSIVMDAEDSVTLRCGEASITLKRDGKVIVKGMNIISSARAANRIVGGSIELN
jgi:hypothetical protein